MTNLKAAGAALLLAWLLMLPAGRAADPDSLQSRIVIGALTYDDGFGGMLKSPAGIWCDSAAGEVFVADAGNGRILIYDELLNCKFSFRHYIQDPTSRATILGEPKGLAVNTRGEILLMDSRTDRLDLLDFRGHVIDGCRPNRLLGDTTLNVRASFVTVDDADQFYLLVTGDLTRILVLSPDLKLIRQMGESGDLPAQFNTPLALAVHNGKIYVGDLRGLPAVKIFDTTGQFLSGFGGHEIERKDMTFPVGFGFLSDGEGGEYILVADALRQAIKAYTAEGEYFTTIGGMGIEPGLVQYPSGMASISATSFYVVERVGARVQRYEIK